MLKLRSMVSQLCGIFPYLCLQFSLGTVHGYTTIVIAELYKKDSEIPATLDQLSWYASLSILKILGSIITGGLIHLFGSRLVGLSAALAFATSYLVYHYSTNGTFILVSGIIGMLLVINSLACPHTSEISEPRYRSSFLAMNHLASSFGMFFCQLLGSLVYWRTIAMVNLLFPLLAAITVLVTPNSPTWLASKGRFDEAEKALCWLRGWVQPIDVETEFRALVDCNPRQNSAITSLRAVQRSSRFFHQFFHRSFYLPLGIICLVFISLELCGSVVFFNYLTVVFVEIKSPIDQSIATAITGAMSIIGRLVVLLFIHRVGKRKLASVSAIVSSVCFIAMAVVGFLQLQGDYLWIPTVAVIVGSLAFSSGISSIAFMLNSEIFPSSIRYLGTSMGVSIFMVTATITNKSFLYVVDAITLRATFVVFAIFNVVSSVACFFIFPETEGRTLKDIEDHFQGFRQSNQVNRS